MPTFDDVTLQLPLDGADGSTTFADVSDSGLSLTATGSAQIDTAQSKWGGASLLLDGSGDNIKLSTANASFGFGLAAWTAEAWIRPSSIAAVNSVFDFRTGSATGTALLYFDSAGKLAYYAGGSNYGTIGTAVVTNTWQHVAWCFDGTTMRMFLNGAQTWSGAVARDFGATRSLYIGTAYDNTWSFAGHIDDVRVTKGAWYTSAFTAPTEAHETGGIQGLLSGGLSVLSQPLFLSATGTFGVFSNSAVLRSPDFLANVSQACFVSAPHVLGSAAPLAYQDFTRQINNTAPITYVMDLITPGGPVRVPISSWQATLQTDVQSYVQCVVPAVTDWVPDIEAATEFVIMRRSMLLDGRSIDYEMARAPAQTVALNGGAYNYTATISGYTVAFEAVENPATSLDRTLTGVRTVSRYTGTTRVRCDIDWLLRPGQRAYLGTEPIVVSFINYYVPGFDQYMDIGDRS